MFKNTAADHTTIVNNYQIAKRNGCYYKPSHPGCIIEFHLLRHAKELQRFRLVVHQTALISKGRNSQLCLSALFIACSVDTAFMALYDAVKSFLQPIILLNGLHLPVYGAIGPVTKGGCSTEFFSPMNPNLSSMEARMDFIGAGDRRGKILSQSKWSIRGTEGVWRQDL